MVRSPRLSTEQTNVLNGLILDGHFSTHIERLFPEFSFTELKAVADGWLTLGIIREKIEKAKLGVKTEGRDKFFNLELWHDPNLSMHSPLVRFVINPQLLSIAAHYLGSMPRLLYVNLWYNIPMDGEDIISQNWHRDGDDENCLKMYLYFNDVDEDMGPFSFIPKSQYGATFGNLWPFGSRLHNVSVSHDIEKYFWHWFKAIGPEGSLVFADTTGLHKGGHTTTKPRFLMVASFITNGSVWRNNKNYQFFESGSMTDSQKYAVYLT